MGKGRFGDDKKGLLFLGVDEVLEKEPGKKTWVRTQKVGMKIFTRSEGG